MGWDPAGKQVRRIIGYYPDRPSAEQAIAQYRCGAIGEYADVTLAELYEMYKHDRAFTELSRQTQDNYEAVYKYYMDDFHGVKFASLRQPQFQIMVDKAVALGRSRSTMEKIKALCSILSTYASVLDIVPKSYATKIKLPAQHKATLPTFTRAEIDRLFDCLDVPLIDTVLIFIYTGMRISELITLKKSDVDIDNMLIVGGVKTDAGRDRIIPIHPKIQPIVRARYETADTYFIEWDKVLGNKKRGTSHTARVPYSASYYRKKYYEALELVGVRPLTPHKARHTFFTMLSEKCTDKKAMALIGGHTDPNFTEKAYVQPDIDPLRKAIETI